MATIKKKNLGMLLFGGVAMYGNVSVYTGVVRTNATGVVQDSDATTPAAINDVVRMQVLQEGFAPVSLQLVVSDAFNAGVKASLGFEYADGVDVPAFPQSATYFGSGLALDAVARLVSSAAFKPEPFPKDVYLTLTFTNAAVNTVGEVYAVVDGERQGNR